MNNIGMKKLLKQVGLVLILTAVYLVVAVPFKVMSVIPGFADIRPVLMLNPVYGIFFGIPGCIAFAIGNLRSPKRRFHCAREKTCSSNCA